MSWAASDIADWWDEEHRQSKKFVDQFVDENPNLFGVIVGTALVTSMELGAGFVDVLRFGEGLAEGGIAGVGKDALRLLGLAGPAGKVAKYAKILRSARLTRLIVDPGANGLCGWVSGAMAFTRTSTKLKGATSVFTTVDDVAAALGKSLKELSAGSALWQRIILFRHLGAKVGPLQRLSTVKEIAALTRNDGSVVMVSLKAGQAAGEGHAVLAFRDILGRLRFLDRGGRAGAHPEVFATLEEIAAKYKVADGLVPDSAAVMENVFVKIVGGIPELTMPVFFTTQAISEKQNETIAQAYTVQKTMVRAGPNAQVLEALKARYHTVVSGDWLSKIARRYYGDIHKWPVIYVANRKVIGKNPDLIKPGQRLVIPALPKVARTGTMY